MIKKSFGLFDGGVEPPRGLIRVLPGGVLRQTLVVGVTLIEVVLAHPTIVAQCFFFILWILTLMLHVPLPIHCQVSGLVVAYRLGVTFVLGPLPSRGDESVGLPTRHPPRQPLKLPLPFLRLYQVLNIMVEAILDLFDLR